MNKKIDDVLFSLIQAKENITNNSGFNINDDSYKSLVDGLDNLITDYTLNSKMSNKEIIDCAASLYGRNNNNFLDKIKNLHPKKIIANIKNRIDDYHKKKELKNKYEDEIVLMIKERLKSMVDKDSKNSISQNEDIKEKQSEYQKDKETIIINNGIIDMNNSTDVNKHGPILVLDKDMAKIVDLKKSGTFVFQDNDNFYAFREADNSNIEKTNFVKFSSLDQAIVYCIDRSTSAKDVRNDFNKFKNKYNNLDKFINDKRNTKKTHSNINYVDNSINMNLEEKENKHMSF